MKPLLCFPLIGIILVVSAGRLAAQPYSFDENGHGTSTILSFDPPLSFPLPSQLTRDPTGGINTSPVLIYILGAPVVPGDVAFVEPGGTTIGALLRFFTPAGGRSSEVIFYSQVDGSLAGVGIPFTLNPYRINEVSPVTTWTPNGSQPGGGIVFPVFDLFQYNVTVTATPEPASTMLLLAAAGMGLTAWAFRRKGGFPNC